MTTRAPIYPNCPGHDSQRRLPCSLNLHTLWHFSSAHCDTFLKVVFCICTWRTLLQPSVTLFFCTHSDTFLRAKFYSACHVVQVTHILCVTYVCMLCENLRWAKLYFARYVYTVHMLHISICLTFTNFASKTFLCTVYEAHSKMQNIYYPHCNPKKQHPAECCWTISSDQWPSGLSTRPVSCHPCILSHGKGPIFSFLQILVLFLHVRTS